MEPRDSLLSLIKHMRAVPSEHLELEVRVGQVSANNTFVAGYANEHRNLITKLSDRLQHNVTHSPLSSPLGYTYEWTAGPDLLILRCEYENGLRRSIIPNQPPEYQLKKRLGKVDLVTDRPYHLRWALSEEKPVVMDSTYKDYNMVKKNPPKTFRYYQRKSFFETVTVPADLGPGSEDLQFRFRYDLSRVSPLGKNKKECTEAPYRFHCEVELVSTLPVTASQPSPEQREWTDYYDGVLADLFLQRAKAVLGTHFTKPASGSLQQTSVPDSTWVAKRLPPVRLVLHSKEFF
jgi:hypothetical protein